MIVAWTSLLHAVFISRGVKPYRKQVSRENYVRYLNKGGDYEWWGFSVLIREYLEDRESPVRNNLRFFIGLRDRIEHRMMPELDDQIPGECQAMLLNCESVISQEFGEEYSLNQSLATALQFSGVLPENQKQAIRRLQSKEYKSVKDYVDRFRSGLSTDVWSSMEYSFRVFLVPKTGNHLKSSDITMEYIDTTQLDAESMKKFERNLTTVKTRQVAVANPDGLKLSVVAQRVEDRLGFRFSTSYDHVQCWKHLKVRPEGGASDPRVTQDSYCYFDIPHEDYLYTEEWVDLRVKNLSDPAKYKRIIGKPSPQSSGSDADGATSAFRQAG